MSRGRRLGRTLQALERSTGRKRGAVMACRSASGLALALGLAFEFAFAFALTSAAADPVYVAVPGGAFPSVIANDASGGRSVVRDFRLRARPVTRGEFYAFVDAHPEWARERVPPVFSDDGYLLDWRPRASLSATEAAQPVTHVSWFASQAFCESEGARLPTWNEWEYVAAADATRRDARSDPAWRASILGWYARPASEAPGPVGGPPNAYGVSDLHGLLWEWVDDFNALLVDADSRSGPDGDRARFCGAGAISLQQRENYAVLMRIALLSSLKAADSTGSLGFRCARPLDTLKDLP